MHSEALRAIDISSNRDASTTIVIEVSGETTADYATLPAPARLVVDLPRVEWQVAKQHLKTQGGLVKGLRFAHNAPGFSRLVFDLRRSVTVAETELVRVDEGSFIKIRITPGEANAYPRPIRTRSDATPLKSGLQTVALSTDVGPSLAHVQTGTLRSKHSIPLPSGKPSSLQGRRPAIRMPGAPDVPLAKPAWTSAAGKGSGSVVPTKSQASPRPAQAKRTKPTIIIDPGHGGHDPGASSKRGRQEKDLVLVLALQLQKQLEASGKYHVKLTRETDRFLSLAERVRFAAKHDGDLFISIHADALEQPQVRGASAYTLSRNPSDNEALASAFRENRVEPEEFGLEVATSDSEAAKALLDLGFGAQKNKADLAARLLVDHLRGQWPLHKKPIKSAGFKVLKSTEVPSVLLEVGYLSNARDEALLSERYDRRRLAKLLVKGIDDYFSR